MKRIYIYKIASTYVGMILSLCITKQIYVDLKKKSPSGQVSARGKDDNPWALGLKGIFFASLFSSHSLFSDILQ